MAAGCTLYADFLRGTCVGMPAPQGHMPLTHERFCMVVQAAGKLSRKQELAMSALLTCPTLLAAAQQCGLAEVTLHRWLKDATFQQAYREARRAVVTQAIAQVQRATSWAVPSIRESTAATASRIMPTGTAICWSARTAVIRPCSAWVRTRVSRNT